MRREGKDYFKKLLAEVVGAGPSQSARRWTFQQELM